MKLKLQNSVFSINKMTTQHVNLEVNNLLVSKYRDQDKMGRERFIIFAINQTEKKLIGVNIINIAEVRRTKNMTLTLGKYNFDEIMKAPENLENIIDDSHDDFDENITFTLSYLLDKGFEFPDTWNKVSFEPSKPKRGCGDKCGDCSTAS